MTKGLPDSVSNNGCLLQVYAVAQGGASLAEASIRIQELPVLDPETVKRGVEKAPTQITTRMLAAALHQQGCSGSMPS